MAFSRDNHYVPCLYLKRFSGADGRISTYRILVADSRFPLWRRSAVKGIAYHAHLYTRIASGIESDEVEKWLNEEFETPAEEALGKATGDMRLTRDDWQNLIRFVAAQDVRTPARLAENLQHWQKLVPALLEETLQNSVRRLELAKRSGETINVAKFPNSEYIPLRVSCQIQPGQEFGEVKSEVIVGRSLWLFYIRHSLTQTVNALLGQRWSILRSPRELNWFTSDNPVIRLNFFGTAKYDFEGGWGKPGTEIFIPLDPQHLLYTKVGHVPRPRGSIVSYSEAKMIRRFIAEHAHRFIFAASVEDDVRTLRPRAVDSGLLRREDEQWRSWHNNQTVAERELMGWNVR